MSSSTQSASKRDVGQPVDLGNGKKAYTVHGAKFEVDAKYDVIKAVGYGAYGTVCSANNTATGQKVAIKKIPKVFDDLVDGKRILREIKLVSFLKHDNIITLLDIFRPLDKAKFEDVYLVSELMDADLHMIIRSKQKLTDEHFQYFICQAFRGLKYIHSANVMHRDLKPGNLLVNGNCDLVICDFGLARGYDKAELTDYVVTRWYRPPELLLLSTRYTPLIDCWSMGCILAELINRKPLFPGRDYINQLNLITDVLGLPTTEDIASMSDEAKRYVASMKEKKRVPLGSILPQASPEAIDFISKLLVFNADKRMTAAQALEHPYLARLHDPKDEPGAKAQFSWELDNSELTEGQLRAGLWEEIVKFHP